MTIMLKLKLLEDPADKQKYIRVTDTTDILRGIARNLDALDICIGVEIADKIREVATGLEDIIGPNPPAT